MTKLHQSNPGRLLYVVGPSGAGKDALLDWAASRVTAGTDGADSGIRFARRWITRPAQAGGEQHHPIEKLDFERRLAGGDFALAWRANGNGYGIGHEIRAWLDDGLTVVVNGSREYLPQALRRFPALQVISISADPRILRERLERRGRESPEQIEMRLARTRELALPERVHAMEIRNEGTPEEAGRALLAAILGN